MSVRNNLIDSGKSKPWVV